MLRRTRLFTNAYPTLAPRLLGAVQAGAPMLILQEYIVDNEQGVKNPIGMSGMRLEANCHIITGQVTAAKNIYKCVDRATLETAGLFLEPLASSEAVLTEEEKEDRSGLEKIGCTLK